MAMQQTIASTIEQLPSEIQYAITEAILPEHIYGHPHPSADQQVLFSYFEQAHESSTECLKAVLNLAKAAPTFQAIALWSLRRWQDYSRKFAQDCKTIHLAETVSEIQRTHALLLKVTHTHEGLERYRELCTRHGSSYMSLLCLLGMLETSSSISYNADVVLSLLECEERQQGARLRTMHDHVIEEHLVKNLLSSQPRCGLCGLFRNGWKCCRDCKQLQRLDHCKTTLRPTLPYKEQATVRQDHKGFTTFEYEFKEIPQRLFRIIRSSETWTADGMWVFGPQG